jgi:hypothetical protein
MPGRLRVHRVARRPNDSLRLSTGGRHRVPMPTRSMYGWNGMAVLLTACAGMAGGRHGAHLAFARPNTAAGDTLSATLFNGTDTTLAFNACVRALERRDAAGRWERVRLPPYEPALPVPPGGPHIVVVCAASLSTLPPGGRVAIHIDVPLALPGGIYRFRFPDVTSEPRAGRAGPPLVSPEFTLP